MVLSVFVFRNYQVLLFNRLLRTIPIITRINPIKATMFGTVSWNISIPKRRVNITSPDWVDSIIAKLVELFFTKSVALKNRIVAITPEKIATIKD
ncbi:hypothetical protein CNEO_44642 [Clostridium neonatale]|uniref:Uncharacterized protein n=1 Tax=Clostridium neonatale TaxID=137838 RepID=A0AA86K2M8_9CLOT|nr:hypothetical protein CNEO_44642 [Clostridium neonatale]